MKYDNVQQPVPNLSTDFVISLPDYPNRLELSYPTSCIFGYVLDGSDPLDNVDSSKEISKKN